MKEYERVTQRQGEPKIVSKRVYYQLRELEDKIENGTLIELPCKVGDKAYLVHNETQRYPFEFFVEDVRYAKGYWYADSCTYGGIIGKYVFFDKAEAEAKLKELQNEHKSKM